MATPVQHKIYHFIRQFIDQHGYSPSLVEIATGIGISPNSISLVSRCIHSLAEAGLISFHKKGYRNIKMVGERACTLPLIEENLESDSTKKSMQPTLIDFNFLFSRKNVFVLKVKGESMIEAGIFDGDLAICQHTHDAEENSIVAALIDSQETTLKRISYRINERITLLPANRALKPKAYLPHRVQIKGVMLGLLRWGSAR